MKIPILDRWNTERLFVHQLFLPHVDLAFRYAVGSIEAIWVKSDGARSVFWLPCMRSRLLSENRIIPDTTSAIQPKVQIHDAV